MARIVYIVGTILAILAIIDVFKKPIPLWGKILTAFLLLLTSWIGLAVYYLFARDRLTQWFK